MAITVPHLKNDQDFQDRDWSGSKLRELYKIGMGKDICVNVTCLGSCNFLLSKAT